MSRGKPSLAPLRSLQVHTQGLNISKRVFTGHPSAVTFLSSAPTIDSIPDYGGIPEVIMVGRANVGKSTLMNYVCAKKDLAVTSSTPGRTQALNFFCVRRVKKGGLITILVDAPGYGARGRPEWGKLFDHYVQNRKELRRVFILINAEHGVTEADKLMLQFLERESQSRKFTVQAVLTKVDKVPQPIIPQVIQTNQRVVSEISPKCLPIIPTGAGKRKFGVMPLRHSILQACGWAPTFDVSSMTDNMV